MKYPIICLLMFLLFSCKKDHTILGIQIARQELQEALLDTSNKPHIFVKGAIFNEQTAVNAVEPILFKIYGKDGIISERPYEIYLLDGYWVLSGTLPEGMLGGTFLIIFCAKDGKVLELTHGK